jgi:hypothetical protein
MTWQMKDQPGKVFGMQMALAFLFCLSSAMIAGRKCSNMIKPDVRRAPMPESHSPWLWRNSAQVFSKQNSESCRMINREQRIILSDPDSQAVSYDRLLPEV